MPHLRQSEVTLNEEQRKALQESIEHWRDNVERHARGESMNLGSEYCACCAYADSLHPNGDGTSCDGCPISQYTGKDDCLRTPYYAVATEKAPPIEMLDWLVKLEAGGTPPVLFGRPYDFDYD